MNRITLLTTVLKLVEVQEYAQEDVWSKLEDLIQQMLKEAMENNTF